MGYYNPVYCYGVDRFIAHCSDAGVDGLIIVDLPPEENDELYQPASRAEVDLIHLITPTTDQARLEILLEKSSGFLYYVSIAGITGTDSAAEDVIKQRVEFIRNSTDLPVAVGFGIKTGDDVRTMTQYADAAVVGSSIVQIIEVNQNADMPILVGLVEEKVRELASGVK
jgi:tryptophan synthase alpha chain